MPRAVHRRAARSRCSRWSGCGSGARARVVDVLGRHEAPARDRARPAALAARAVPRRADDRPRPADARRRSGTTCDELRSREEITIFLTTHYMDEAEHCDRIAIIDEGRIIALDTPEALKASVGTDRVQIATADDDGGDRRARASVFEIEAERPRRRRSRSTSPTASTSCRACSPSSACRSARSASRGRRSTTSSWPTRARTIRDAEASADRRACAPFARGARMSAEPALPRRRGARRAARACAATCARCGSSGSAS